MNKHLINVSKRLTWILRHQLDKFFHDAEGYVKLSDIIITDTELFYGINDEKIQLIVNNDSKTRLSLKKYNGDTYIRANQGHSSGNLNDEKMLKPIIIPINDCFHGTYERNLKFIKSYGLSRMKRKHIHIAESEESKSGKRYNCNVKIYIDMKLALEEGIKFYRSENGVILTPGNNEGILHPKYFSKIELINNRI